MFTEEIINWKWEWEKKKKKKVKNLSVKDCHTEKTIHGMGENICKF